MIKNKRDEFLQVENWDEWFVVADFDRTISSGNSKTSWSILASSDLVPSQYVDERNALYEIYRPIEIDPNLPFEEKAAKVKEWFRLHINLFIKYGIREELFEKAASDLRIMEFRHGAQEFLQFLAERGVPVIIISAGIGNFIECFLRNNGCLFDNIYISSNKITFTDGVASGVSGDIIHSLNKNEVSLPDEVKAKLVGRERVILLGDQPSDLKMVDETKHEQVIKVGFVAVDTADNDHTEMFADFDLVIEPDEDYDDMMRVLDRKRSLDENKNKVFKRK